MILFNTLNERIILLFIIFRCIFFKRNVLDDFANGFDTIQYISNFHA